MRLLSASLLSRLAATAAFSMLGLSATAKASAIPITVVNGGFETLGTAGTSGQLYAPGATTDQNTQTVTGWTSGKSGNLPGYNFVFSSDATNAGGVYGPAHGAQNGNLSLWSKNLDATSNGIGPSPAGGNFLALDGAYETASISQVINGLTVGMDTQVSFYFAGAQQSGKDGATTEQFKVSLGTQNDYTAVLNNVSHGFTGWQYVTLDFVPTSTSETLSFLAVGTPSGVPPFSLLDGITVQQVTPEPSTLALFGTGVLAMGALLRRRRTSNL